MIRGRVAWATCSPPAWKWCDEESPHRRVILSTYVKLYRLWPVGDTYKDACTGHGYARAAQKNVCAAQ